MKMHNLTVRILIIAFIVLVIADSAQAVEDPPDRPRVGLVLGGGGARGAAHIGVLRELERLNIPVDAIAGTSMGAIVGGLYATGMTPAELEGVIASLDWGNAFKDSSNRQDMRYRRKQDDAAYPMSLELGLRDGELLLPKGVLQGQQLGLVLRHLTLDVAEIDQFDDLPIPFRAVASDIETGEAVVMDSGDLALAIRASVSAPGIFAPAKLDGRTLVDGGLVGNVPVEAIREMNVDIIIAVDVEFPLYKPDELTTALSITGQMLTILIRKETRRQLELLDEQDFLIRPELGEFGSTNFAEIAEAVEPGAVATREMEDRLRSLSLSDEQFAAHLANRRRSAEPGSLDFVRVSDDGTLSPKVLESRLQSKPGDKIDSEQLATDAARLYGLQLYEQVDYRITNDNGNRGVEFLPRAKDWGPNFLKFGLALQDDIEGDTKFNVAARLTRAGINSLGAEWRTDLQLGTDPFISSEFYQPLSFDSRFFLAPRASVEQTNFNIFLDDDNVARYRVTDAGLGIDIGRELGLWGEVRLGVFRGIGSARLKVGAPEFPTIDFQSGGIFASFNIDTLDNAQIPLKGTRVNIELIASRPGMGADESFDTLDAAYTGAWSVGRHTLSAGLRYATSRNSENLPRNFFTLGGFLNLSAFATGEISGPHAALARLVYYRRSGQIRGSFDVPLYLGASLEVGNVWQSRSDMSASSALINGSLFVAVDTFVGPLFFAAGIGEGGNRSLYLSIGHTPK